MQLVLTSFGTSLHQRKGLFEVVSPDGKSPFAPEKVTSIVLGLGCRISADAALLALANEIPVLLQDRSGQVQGRIWSARYGTISTLRRNQVAFTRDLLGYRWVIEQVRQKLRNQQRLLTKTAEKTQRDRLRDVLDSASKTIAQSIQELDNLQTTEIFASTELDRIRGLEGAAGRAFFSALSDILPAEYRFQKRSKRPAKDRFNCVLNYLYGMLYGYVESALIQAGLDPYLGILHADEYNRPTLAFDAIEPYRIYAENVALRLALRKLLAEELFDIHPDTHAVWLNATGKRLIIPAFNDYLHEVVDFRHKRRSRLNHLNADLQAFAQQILAFQPPESTEES